MTRTLLHDVRVYRDGRFGEAADVSVDDGLIVSVSPTYADDEATRDGATSDVVTGGYLIPGLIDAHVHLESPESLEMLADHGVTTAFDMGSPSTLIHSLRRTSGVTDIRSSLMVATSPTSAHAARMHATGDDVLVGSPDVADSWVASHAEQGADYIKIVIDLPGFDEETVAAIVTAAHDRGLITVAHASSFDAVGLAQSAGVDVLTHAPLDRPVGPEQAEALVAAGTVTVPTLIMMRDIVARVNPAGGPGPQYEAARTTVANLRAAGMPVIAGTDANRAPGAPAAPPYGESLHDELGLLVEAGLSPAEALDAATAAGADRFGLADRGRIAPGLRADLVLLGEDPTADIPATRSITGVWCAGVRRR